MLFCGLITTVSYWPVSSDQKPVIIMLHTCSRDMSDWIAVRYDFLHRQLLVLTVLNNNALLRAISPNWSTGSSVPKNSAMAKCRTADTTWNWLSASGIQPTKNQIRNKTSSHITPSAMKGWIQTLWQNCASANQHKPPKAHGKARSSYHGGTVGPRKLGQ